MSMQTVQQMLHSPTLNTVLMVEEAIKGSDKSVLTVAELKKLLPRQVNHNTLIQILEYLEESNKIAVSIKGITWIHNRNATLLAAATHGLEL
ncbi:MAG: hypothetical protein KAW41_03545 [Candidatus Diapherotrites archaeon]|nr:hypothetical protein [Candidatus Diapherotrites archaeon]